MSQDTLKQLSALCANLRDAEREAEGLEAKRKAKEAEARRLAEEDIPALMQELGVQKIKLDSGEEIKVELEVYAQISRENKPAAFQWLEENGHGGMIKTEVTVAFGRDELEQAKAVAQSIAEQTGKDAAIDRSVHASTLKAWLRERIKAGAVIPLELFGARPVNTAKIK